MAKISIEPNQAIKYGEDIIRTGDLYRKEINNVYNIVDELKKYWRGSAAERFTRDIEKFRADYEKLATLIKEVGDVLVSTGKDYNDLENSL